MQHRWETEFEICFRALERFSLSLSDSSKSNNSSIDNAHERDLLFPSPLQTVLEYEEEAGGVVGGEQAIAKRGIVANKALAEIWRRHLEKGSRGGGGKYQ